MGHAIMGTDRPGSLIVAEFDSLDAARAWAENDSDQQAGVFERLEVKPFKPVLP